MNEDFTDYIKIIIFLFFVLGGLMFLGSCDSGWSVAGYEV
tara:strand:- start:278 stop:397 length:120 start_codon:yes stop_codon:yes gene_type:complete